MKFTRGLLWWVVLILLVASECYAIHNIDKDPKLGAMPLAWCSINTDDGELVHPAYIDQYRRLKPAEVYLKSTNEVYNADESTHVPCKYLNREANI